MRYHTKVNRRDKMQKQISKTDTIGEVLELDEGLAEIFLGFGMHCLYCPMSRMETLEEAASVHGIDLDLLVKKLNEARNFSVKGKVKSQERLKKGSLKK